MGQRRRVSKQALGALGKKKRVKGEGKEERKKAEPTSHCHPIPSSSFLQYFNPLSLFHSLLGAGGGGGGRSDFVKVVIKKKSFFPSLPPKAERKREEEGVVLSSSLSPFSSEVFSLSLLLPSPVIVE